GYHNLSTPSPVRLCRILGDLPTLGFEFHERVLDVDGVPQDVAEPADAGLHARRGVEDGQSVRSLRRHRDPALLLMAGRPHVAHGRVLEHLEPELVPIELEGAILIAHVDPDRPDSCDHGASLRYSG